MKDQKLTLPRRKELFIVQRDLQEQREERRRKKQERKERVSQRREKRKRIGSNPIVRVCGGLLNLIWMLAVSLALTLTASYLASSPSATKMFENPIEYLFRADIAGANPLPVPARQNLHYLTVQHKEDLSSEYIGKEDLAIEKFDLEKEYFAEGYQGVLKLKKLELTPILSSFTGSFNQTEEYRGLSTNDVEQLPTAKLFEMRSNEGIGAKTKRKLRPAEWAWEIEEYDDLGLPIKYKAFVTYRGEESWLDYASLQANAYYSGQVYRSDMAQGPFRPSESPSVAIHDPLTFVTTLDPTLNGMDLADDDDIELQVNEAVLDEEFSESQGGTADSGSQSFTEEQDENTGLSMMNKIAFITAAATTAALAGGGPAVVYFRRKRKRQNELYLE